LAGGSGSGLNDVAFTKEENAQFFKGVKCQVGLETPVVPLNEPRTVKMFLDHYVDLFGWLRSTPFPFPVSRIEVTEKAARECAEAKYEQPQIVPPQNPPHPTKTETFETKIP
jgi:hypothetical protein